ncbi:uncharacterized protein LOC135468619 isoform X2 [Liolophura sinensis]|uniref:uncharacterized protein LOC135468619 isoform X2 n=1 Tax=Liolophura sinensis TaxID=3198878 RepID=UPI0031587873
MDLAIIELERPLRTTNSIGMSDLTLIFTSLYTRVGLYIIVNTGVTLQNEAASRFRLWMGFIGGFENQVPNLLEIGSGFEKMLRRMYELGLAQHAAVMVAGHGYGGATLSDYVDLNPDMFKALILFSHAPPRYQKMTDFTVPTLFMSGDLDGVMTIFTAAQLFQRVVQQSEFAPDLLYDTPVVTLEGVNHTHYFSGKIPDNFTYTDIEGDISYPAAWGNISRYVVAFMITQAQAPAAEVPAAKALLQAAFSDNQDRMGKIWAVQEMDQNDDGHSPWVEESQVNFVGLQGKDQSRLRVSSDVVSEVELPPVKPKAALNGSVLMVETYVEVSPPRGLDKVNASFTPTQLQAKMKSKDAVLAMLPNVTAQTKNLTCENLNMMCFQTAKSMASDIAQRRFIARGRKLQTEPDIEARTGVQWLTKQLLLNYTPSGLNVTSYSLLTPTNFFIRAFAGMHYCKLLAPSRALEWIYVDSLRGTKPTEQV